MVWLGYNELKECEMILFLQNIITTNVFTLKAILTNHKGFINVSKASVHGNQRFVLWVIT